MEIKQNGCGKCVYSPMEKMLMQEFSERSTIVKYIADIYTIDNSTEISTTTPSSLFINCLIVELLSEGKNEK